MVFTRRARPGYTVHEEHRFSVITCFPTSADKHSHGPQHKQYTHSAGVNNSSHRVTGLSSLFASSVWNFEIILLPDLMSLNLPQQRLVSSSSSNALISRDPVRACFSSWGGSRKKWRIKLSLSPDGNLRLSCRLVNSSKYSSTFSKSKRGHIFRVSSADDGVTVNGSPQGRSSSDANEIILKLDQSLESKDYNDGLVQTLHDAARVFELALKEQSSSLKMSWFSTAWLGVDKNAWMKGLAYQASVYALLQAGIEIASRGDGRDRDINVFVQRSLLRQSGPLASVLREKLSAKQPEGYEWFWSDQVPAVATSFVNYFESNPRFEAATSVFGKGKSSTSRNANETSLLMLALSCVAAITKLGSTKIACSQFFSMIPDTTGRLMDMLVNFIPIRQAYISVKDIGLAREFLVHFGPRAGEYKADNDRDMEEVVFWVTLFQKQLQRAIHRERIWSRLTTCESIEVLEKDLSVFGFFIALGRSSQSFLSVNGFDVVEEPLESLLRYLIGGSVLYYPQLSSISSYQLYVDVVCEELEWLPFYPGITSTSKIKHDHGSKQERVPNAEAVSEVLEVCSYWIQSFIKYSKLLENPSNVKAARFLSRGHNKLKECMGELGIQENNVKNPTERTGTVRYSLINRETESSFNKALESVEEAMIRLEKLLQELHVSSSTSGKEQLKAACSDLERIRRLKKEAEFLEASFSAKAASLRQGDDDNGASLSISDQQQQYRGKNRKTNAGKSKPPGLWDFLLRQPTRDSDPGSARADGKDEVLFNISSPDMDRADSESNEIRRFEVLRNELIELERRVQGSANQSEIEEEEIKIASDTAKRTDESKGGRLLVVQKKDNLLEKSLDKLRETTTDVWQGTQLLAIDVGSASGLLRRVLIGDDLTEKEKKALQRTLTDVAAVVPIGILMLLPVTAVGHAAMLAAIQRYVPSMIPSTYGQERLSLLRQLEKVKELEKAETSENEEDEPE